MAIASAIYDTYSDASAAVERVKAAGVPARDISILSNDPAERRDAYGDYRYDDIAGDESASAAGTGAGLGAVAGGAAGLLAGLGMIAIPGLGPIVAAGWLAATAVGAGAGVAAGGIVGALVGAGLGEEEAHAYAEGLRRGGTVVNVRTSDADVGRIQAILDSGAYSVADRAASWRKEGWSGRYIGE